MKWKIKEVYFCKSRGMNRNWENSEIIDKLISYLKELNVIIPTDQYIIYIYLYTHRYNWFGSNQRIERFVIVGCGTIQ